MSLEVNRTLILGASGVGILIAAAVCLPPGSLSAREATHPDRSLSTRLVSAAERPQEAAPSSVPFEHYRPLLQRNPFAPRLPKKVTVTVPDAPALPQADPGEKKSDEKKADEKKPDTPKPPEPPDPLKDWVYNGTVAIGSDVYAVLENKTSKRSQYARRGDVVEGASIENIAQGELSLKLNGQPRTLAKSTSFNATPLNGGAPGAGGAAPAGGNGAPGPNGAPGAKPGPGGPAPAPSGAVRGAYSIIGTRASAPAGGASPVLSAPVAAPTTAPAPAK